MQDNSKALPGGGFKPEKIGVDKIGDGKIWSVFLKSARKKLECFFPGGAKGAEGKIGKTIGAEGAEGKFKGKFGAEGAEEKIGVEKFGGFS